MGIIDSLSAGYRFLGRRLELLVVPILLDLLFWLGPQVSAAPLFRQLAEFYGQAEDMEGLPPELVSFSNQLATSLAQSGEQSNLLGALVNSSLLHVPTLLAGGAPISTRSVIEVQSPTAALLLLIGFSLLGVLIGVIYMNMLAQSLPLGDGPKTMRFSDFMAVALRHWLMVLLYLVLLVVALFVSAIPVGLLITLFTLISPYLGSLLVALVVGTVFVVVFYLYFVPAALILDNLPVHRAIMQSFVVVRNNFWATLGFVSLNVFIMLGFGYIMVSLAAIEPVGTLAAICLYAYIGSGLAMALLVFYRTRILKQEERLAPVA